MKEKLKLMGAIVIYILAFFMLGYYLYIEIVPSNSFDMSGRIFYLSIICLLIYFGSFFLSKTKYFENNKPMKVSLGMFFIFYLILLITLVAFDYFRGEGISFIFTSKNAKDFFNDSVNLIPFNTIIRYFKAFINNSINFNIIVYNLFGNIICLIPLAFFLPRLFKKQNKFKVFLITIILVTFSIEILQLVTMRGSFDVDDMILNTFGACIFYTIFNIKAVKNLLNNIFLLEKNKFNKKDIVNLIIIFLAFIIISITLFVIVSNFKNDDYGYSIDFVDESTSFICNEELEQFYENDNYIYYFNCSNKSDYIYVIFKNNDGEEKYLLKDFLNSHSSKYKLDDYILQRSSLDITIKFKKTELVINSDVEGIYEYNLNDDSICDVDLNNTIINIDNSTEYHLFIEAKKEGKTIFTFKQYDYDTKEEVFNTKYEIIVDSNLEITYNKLS